MSDNIFWPNYLFFTDFSTEADALLKIPTGVLSADDAKYFASLLSQHDTGAYRANWTDEEGADYTLAGATVLFSGENHTDLPSNANFSHVVVLQFAWGNAPRNVVAVQYNVVTPTPTPGV